jgi:hypothetical protein
MADNGNMNDEKRFRVSEAFSEDMKGLFAARESVPGEVDRAVMDAAGRRFAGRKRRMVLRWAGSVAAAAAVLVFAFVLTQSRIGREPEFSAMRVYSFAEKSGGLEGDIDMNGEVNILDAFKLAKGIEAGTEGDLRWDINGDGMVDRRDVDSVAYAAVRLKREVSL